MRFVETSVSTGALQRHLDDERYRQLQIALMLLPEQGPIITGSGGLRKVRWALAGVGKRGGVRVIYYWEPGDCVFCVLYMDARAEQGDLTPPQVRALAKVVREEFE